MDEKAWPSLDAAVNDRQDELQSTIHLKNSSAGSTVAIEISPEKIRSNSDKNASFYFIFIYFYRDFFT